ncbi:hypothetical protein ACQ4PT_042204 [Festuca glaucescens]
MVKPRLRRRRTVFEGLRNNAWATDIAGPMSVDAVVQFLSLWEAIASVPQVGDGVQDSYRWKWTTDGVFTSRSTYCALFQGRTALPGAANVWDSFAPMPYKFHAWLALRRRCWSADRMARHGMQSHVACPLCNADAETLDHLSLLCPFAQRVWSATINGTGIQLQLPDQGLGDWWSAAVCMME